MRNTEKTMRHRLKSLFCCATMILSLLPIQSFAYAEVLEQAEVKFIDDIVVVFQTGTDTAENKEWLTALLKAKQLFLRQTGEVWHRIRMRKNGIPLTVVFGINRNVWFSGLYEGDGPSSFNPDMVHTVFINEQPNGKDPFHFEYGAENGFEKTERLYTIVHELAHAYDHSEGSPRVRFDLEDAVQTACTEEPCKNESDFVVTKPLIGTRIYYKDVFREAPPTVYPLYFCRYAPHEDFAESVALFVLFPRHLKEYYPIRYEFLLRIFKTEYEDAEPMPSSVRARLLRERTAQDGTPDGSMKCSLKQWY